MVYVKDVNQPSLPTPFYSVPVSVSVFMVLSTAFRSMTSPNNSPLSHCSSGHVSALLVLSTLHLKESLPQPWYNPFWLTGLKVVWSCLPVHQVWPKPSCKAQWHGEEDKVDRRRGGKTTSGNGQAWSSAGSRGQWRTGNNGENWLRNHLRCANDPRG